MNIIVKRYFLKDRNHCNLSFIKQGTESLLSGFLAACLPLIIMVTIFTTNLRCIKAGFI